ncbi:MAG: hypothetical protein ACRDHP_20910 [Ktedonobacterales bacterium]
MPPVVRANAALDADAPLVLALLCALLGGIEALKWMRLRRHTASERETKMALGGVLGSLIFTAMFVAIVGFGVEIGEPLVTLPRFIGLADWLHAGSYLVPLIIVGWNFLHELWSLLRMA